ncbi:AAA family ATPase [Nocardia sp. NPDC050718]|uniref:AAA family ATPase n=1 Tax=Nocardia sp. NPDC050718 TaxID=3155788 RepID=UPI0033C69E3F
MRYIKIFQSLIPINHSSTSNTKYREFEGKLSDELGVGVEDIYTTYINERKNANVRILQSRRATSTPVIVALAGPADDTSAIVQAIFAGLERDRKTHEVLVMSLAGNAWAPFAVLLPTDRRQAILDQIIQNYADLNVEIYQSGLSELRTEQFKFFDGDISDTIGKRYYPFGLLKGDDWDDFGYRTMFSLEVHLARDRSIIVGDLKILNASQSGGRTQLPGDSFLGLDDSYCSLGQSVAYYEILADLPGAMRLKILNSLRDAAVFKEVAEQFKHHRGFTTSLLRTGQASHIMSMKADFGESKLSLAEEKPTSVLTFTFHTLVGGGTFPIEFCFKRNGHLPGRVNAVIGYNGSGKTRLLANLALVATSGPIQREHIARQVGYIEDSELTNFRSVIAISYSAFDTFALPDVFWAEQGGSDVGDRLMRTGEVFGYSYFGLRKLGNQTNNRPDIRNIYSPRDLKSIDELSSEFVQAHSLAVADNARLGLLREVAETLNFEPSFGRAGVVVDPDRDTQTLGDLFDELSSGHKIVINILTQLVAHCGPTSLVLIDEPESHLHPSLLAAFMRALSIVLEKRDAFAIIATHSPVVIQEVPRAHVRVLNRFGQSSEVNEPDWETFGENIGALTSNVFRLDSSRTDYHAVLTELSSQMSLAEIEALFDGEMSPQARAYVRNLKRKG